jgi:DNA-binding response OmpR family regulator
MIRIALPPSKSGVARTPGARPCARAPKWILVVGEDAHATDALARTLEGPNAALSYATPHDALDRLALGEPYDLVVVQRDLASASGASLRDEIERAAPQLLVVEMAIASRTTSSSVTR